MKIKVKIINMNNYNNKKNTKDSNNRKIYYNHQNNGSHLILNLNLNLNINNNFFPIVIQFITKIVKNKIINING
jgi:hypothetical protein